MSQLVNSSTIGDSGSSVETLTWTVRLSDNAPQKRWVVYGAALFAAIAGYLWTGQPLIGIVGFAIILGSTAEYWLGVRYRVDGNSVARRCGLSVTEIHWENVKRVIVDQNRIKLSPLEEDSRLSEFRGVTLVTTQDNHEAVLAAVEAHRGNHGVLAN
jgi:hypothetical protein